MENNAGNVNASDLATLSLIGGAGGYGGYGVGASRGHYGSGGTLYAGNSVLAANAHADGTAVKAAIDGNADLIRAQAGNFENVTRDTQFSSLSMQNADQTTRICDRLSAQELNNLRAIADTNKALAECCCETQKAIAASSCETQKAIAEAAKEAAKCCCETKLESSKNHAEVLAAIAAQTAASITRELDAANSRITQLETINALAAANNNNHRK